MQKRVSIEEFYKSTHQYVPESVKSGIGHFNVFKLDEFAGPKPKPMPFNRRDYFKISLVRGKSRVHYADKVVKVEKQVMVFSNPQIPYNWEKIDEQLTGYFCVFTDAFFHRFGDLAQYPVFQPSGNPVFQLTDAQLQTIVPIFKRMFTEIESDYAYKYDVLRNLVFELIHTALKLQPAIPSENLHSNASERISGLFMELLERQFPIESPMQRMRLRSASDFARQLGVHVNHLNRALKEILQKSTSILITERVVQEAKILLRHTNWNVSEIAHTLGFEETAHFSNFFKKHANHSPIAFRKLEIV
ncbi:helix-turn-helix domain-containing protein [Allomuricauda sp. SCSIO 65647]|uniref:helix-turn-helix domain-containing protein n=1 Tax=Allomuricauda sp. SCSIO 65647 TaxID=2908843 RepID=UPI001F25A921|nr:AraC family transcriptional regulator [Muricauda sp. SCSIO 65647]UJH67713.1 helix-turn-helix transcriptional regulator [Muricauda sp. SCSIO 65647]